MKGKLETSQILRAVVNEEHGLGMGGVMSHVAVNDVPNYHKFLLTTDGGMNVAPNFNMKLGILVNAVNTLRALGYEAPKVAVLANAEKVDPKIPESVEAGKLKDMYTGGEIKNCIVEGPVALDIALVKERAEVKHFESPVAGDADIILSLGSRAKPEEIGANLFKTLRKFDFLGVDVVYSEVFSEKGEGMAIMNRLNKAAGYRVLEAE